MVNNVVYYAYFDTAVNGYLIEASGTDVHDPPSIRAALTALQEGYAGFGALP